MPPRPGQQVFIGPLLKHLFQFCRLIAMKESPSHEKILQELVMDILRVLSSPDLEVRKKTLALAMDLVTSRNIDELVLVLKKVRMALKTQFLELFM